MGHNKCIVCLNYVKPRIKLIARHSLEEQLLITFFLKKLFWTPLGNESFTEYLQTGNPSEWAALCHICEQQVKAAFDIHRQVEKLISRISRIRRSLYAENFYESDDEDEDGNTTNDKKTEIFSKLRSMLLSDYQSKQWKRNAFQQSVFLKYHSSSTNQYERNDDSCISDDFRRYPEHVKQEPLSDIDNNYDDIDDNFSDSMGGQSIDDIFEKSNGAIKTRQQGKSSLMQVEKSMNLILDKSKLQTNTDEFPCLENESDGADSDHIEDSTDLPWTSGKVKPRKTKKKNCSNNNTVKSVKVKLLEPIPEDIPRGTKECPKCMNKFVNGSSMRRHYREKHLKREDHRCPCCDEIFGRKEHLQCHIQYRHPEKIADIVEEGSMEMETFECQHCQEKFYIRTSLVRHIQEVHPTVRKMYKCDLCEDKFETKESLFMHKKVKHGSEMKNLNCDDADVDDDVEMFQCNICDKLFRSELSMQRHIKESHEKIKEHGCHLCSKVFARRSYVFRHIQNEHKTETPVPVSCEICHKVCNGQASLSRHMQTVHKQRQISTCKVCGKTYTQVAALNIHMRFAHGEVKKLPSASSIDPQADAGNSDSNVNRTATKVQK